MADYLRMLLDQAFETLPGELYNPYLQDVSRRGGQSFLFYEISLMGAEAVVSSPRSGLSQFRSLSQGQTPVS